jgi:hypothetical protein
MNRPNLQVKIYDANRLFDSLLNELRLENDTLLSNALNVTPSVIHDMRMMRLPIDAPMLIWMQVVTGIAIDELRQIVGDRRQKLRYSDGAEEVLD